MQYSEHRAEEKEEEEEEDQKEEEEKRKGTRKKGKKKGREGAMISSCMKEKYIPTGKMYKQIISI